jgi:hypothetical protein
MIKAGKDICFYRKSKFLPFLVIGFIAIIVLYVDFRVKLYNKPDKVICYDALEYYSYLPALFVYHDLSFQFKEDYSNKFWPLTTPNGGRVIKMNMGMSLLYSPFFLITHYVVPKGDFKPDGFSPPYKVALLLSSLVYLVVGLYFLWKILKEYFSPVVVSITLIAITFGTNIFYYTTFEAPLSHVYSFCLFGIFIWMTPRWYSNPCFKNTVLIGLLFGLITLVRVSNALVILFFLMWGLKGFDSAVNRIKFYISHFYLIAGILFLAFLVWIPQFIYWKYNTGEWIYYTYGKERFFFNDPQVINGLFSYRKGWLLYTPLMILPFIAFYRIYRNYRIWFLPILVYLIFQIYVVFSWWTWWYGGSFGQRPMIESYAILAFPLAVIIHESLKAIKFVKLSTLIFISICVFYSVFQASQYYQSAIHWDSMTKEAYWDSFLRLHPTKEFDSLLDHPDYDAALKGKRN